MNEDLRLYALYDDAEELWLDPMEVIRRWEQQASADDPLPVLYERAVRDNHDFFPTGADVAEYLSEQASDGMGCLFDEELTAIDEDGHVGEALGDPEVVALLDQAMKLAVQKCRYYVAGELIRKIPVVRNPDGTLSAAVGSDQETTP